MVENTNQKEKNLVPLFDHPQHAFSFELNEWFCYVQKRVGEPMALKQLEMKVAVHL